MVWCLTATPLAAPLAAPTPRPTCRPPGAEDEAAARSAILRAVGPEAPVFTKPIFGFVQCKGIYDDWVRTLDVALEFQDAHHELSEPPGFWIQVGLASGFGRLRDAETQFG
ncbi:MAG: hypothetical protein NTX16_11335 [Actinobacteria bacterium]|nr:hypothetical protein [Actinomycetota bacterium]